MPLPAMPAWIMDYVTAQQAFALAPANALQNIVGMCAAGHLKFSAYEDSSFKRDATTKQHFCNQGCRCNLDGDIAEIVKSLPDSIGGRKVHPRDLTCKIVVATAINNNYGIVSYKSGMFLTPSELGQAQNLTCLDLHQFISLL